MPSDNATLRAYLRVQMGWERELATLLSQAAADAHQHIERIRSSAGIGDQVRVAQLRQAQRAILRQQSALWFKIGETIKSSEATAAAATVRVAAQYDDELLSRVMGPSGRDLYARSLESTARSGVELAKARMQGKSYIPLSEQVYKSEQWSNGVLNNTINSGLARGLSAAEIADSVKDFINPRTPGGVKYAAQRLGRTEINNAAHATSLSKYAKTPWVTAVRWQLSGSHPRPDECNEYADVGLYPPEDVPEKPHPNCLCYVTPDTVPADEFIKQYNAGAYDAYLDDVMRESGYSEDLIALTKGKPSRVSDLPAQPLWDLGGGRGLPGMESTDPSVRGANMWAQTYQGQSAVRAALRNVRKGRDPFEGPELDEFYDRWGTSIFRYGKEGLEKFSLEDAKAEILNSARYIESLLGQVQTSSRTLYRGMRMDEVFQEGQIFDVDFASATLQKKVANHYLEENGYRSGQHQVMMILDDVDSVDIDRGLMADTLEGSEEHLVSGRMQVVSSVLRGEVWEVRVVRAN